ncbi:MAG: radical SAM protein [Rhodocyclaceae bacterium]|nr:radical SAM protein [Rhodocyclaceae bacterium]
MRLAHNGELKRRAAEAIQALAECKGCPRNCEVNRLQDEMGTCLIGRRAKVASHFPHLGEEDCLRGWRGSGTLFLAGCGLRCVFCQNFEISHKASGRAVSAEELAEIMLGLQQSGCHNVNWVTPSHVVPQLLEALEIAARQGLKLPIVYNSSGYDSVATLRWLDGVVDIYMPDFKFWEPDVGERLAEARDYPEVAREAIAEMHRQVGDLVIGKDGLARRGLLVRHLVMPNGISGTKEIADWLAQRISLNTFINVMSQYHPDGDVLRPRPAEHFSRIARPIFSWEFNSAVADAQSAGLHRFETRTPTQV